MPAFSSQSQNQVPDKAAYHSSLFAGVVAAFLCLVVFVVSWVFDELYFLPRLEKAMLEACPAIEASGSAKGAVASASAAAGATALVQPLPDGNHGENVPTGRNP